MLPAYPHCTPQFSAIMRPDIVPYILVYADVDATLGLEQNEAMTWLIPEIGAGAVCLVNLGGVLCPALDVFRLLIMNYIRDETDVN